MPKKEELKEREAIAAEKKAERETENAAGEAAAS